MDLVEVAEDAYTQWLEQWLRERREAVPAIGAPPAGARPPPPVGERGPASSVTGDYVPPRRYWRVVRCFSTPQQESMHGIFSRVGKVEGEEFESVDLKLPDGVFAGPGNAPRAALVPRVRDTC